jgi:Protein of unknown function (DUF4087)
MTHAARRKSLDPGRLVPVLGVAASSMLILLLTLSGAARADGTPVDTVRTRCGWFDNPSPGNATLADRDGEWTVAMQGEPSATGRWPTFKRSQWVRTGNGSAGYGCACLKVREDAESHRITHIVEARANALAVCRRDAKLTEPDNPLK